MTRSTKQMVERRHPFSIKVNDMFLNLFSLLLMPISTVALISRLSLEIVLTVFLCCPQSMVWIYPGRVCWWRSDLLGLDHQYGRRCAPS